MGLETGNFIADLEPVYPLPADGKDEGDDHIRLIKTVLQNSIAGFPGAVLVGGQDVGVSNAYVLSPADPLRAYSVNLLVFWLPANTNGGASTINIAGLGAQPIRRNDGTALENGDIMAGNPVAMLYNGTQFRLTAVTKRYVDSLISSGILPGQTGNGGKPLVTDGVNATFSNAFGVAIDEAAGAPIASAATLVLTSAAGTGNFTHITGSASISAITLPAGASRDLVFDATPTLVNGANLILPTGANIIVEAGDTARVRGEAGGVVRVFDYLRKSGRALAEPAAPGLVLLATLTPTNGVAAVDFLTVFSSTYDDYRVMFSGLSNNAAGNVPLALQLAQASIVDTASNYVYGTIKNSSGDGTGAVTSQNSINASAFISLGVNARNSGGAKGSGVIEISGVNNAAIGDYQFAQCNGTEVSFVTGSPSKDILVSSQTSGAHKNTSTSAITGLRLFWLGGSTFAAGGVIRIYGYKRV